MNAPVVHDVVIVGAGPAGCSTAITLARAGRRVLVIDKARFPREKCCGDGLTTGALRRLEALGLHPSAVASFTRVDHFVLRSSSGRVASIDLDRGRGVYAAIARRRDLDRALVELTRASGATVLEGSGFSRLRTSNGLLCLGLEDERELYARYAVGADGAWSSLRRACSGQPARVKDRLDEADIAGAGSKQGADWYAFRAYVRGVSLAASLKMWVWFEERLLPGYAWSFPLANGGANLGLYLRRDRLAGGAALQQAWRTLLDSPFVASLLGPDAELEGPARAWPIPTDISRAQLSAHAGRVLFVGDAARAADPFSGEGIAQALESGAAAGAAIDADIEAPELVARRYRAHIDKTLARDHRLARAASRLISSGRAERAIVSTCAHSPGIARQVGRWLFEDYPRSAFFSPLGLSRSTFSRPGAYAPEQATPVSPRR